MSWRIMCLLILAIAVVNCKNRLPISDETLTNFLEKNLVGVSFEYNKINYTYWYDLKIISRSAGENVVEENVREYKDACSYLLNKEIVQRRLINEDTYVLSVDFCKDIKPTGMDGEIAYFDPMAVKEAVNRRLIKAQENRSTYLILNLHQKLTAFGDLLGQNDKNQFEKKVLIRIIQGNRMRVMIYRLELKDLNGQSIVTEEKAYQEAMDVLIEKKILSNRDNGSLCVLPSQYDIKFSEEGDFHRQPPIPEKEVRDTINQMLKKEQEIQKFSYLVCLSAYVMTSDIIAATTYNEEAQLKDRINKKD